ncbi:hypothetical protein Tco_0364849 [Tanacetum coccineum]
MRPPTESDLIIDTKDLKFLKGNLFTLPTVSTSTVEESIDKHEIGDEYLTEKQQQQLALDEEALRETLEEEARAEKEWDERIRQERARDELFKLEFKMKSYSEYKSD